MTETPVTLPSMPLFAYEITDDMKAEYVRLIYAGHRPDSAARQIGSTGTQFRFHRSRNSQYYDPEFAEEVTVALASEEHDRHRLEMIRGWQDELAEAGNTRMVEKLSYERDPNWASLKHPNFLTIELQVLAQAAPKMSPEVLEQIIEAYEAAEGAPPSLKLLEAGNDEQA